MSKRKISPEVVPFHSSSKRLIDRARRKLESLGHLKGGNLLINKSDDPKVMIAAGALCHAFRVQKQIIALCGSKHSDCAYPLGRNLFDLLVNLLLAIKSDEQADRYHEYALIELETYIRWVQGIREVGDATNQQTQLFAAILEKAETLRKKYNLNPSPRKDWYGKQWKDKYQEVGLEKFFEMPYRLYSDAIHAGAWTILRNGKITNDINISTYRIDGEIGIPTMVLAESGKIFILILTIFSSLVSDPRLLEAIDPEDRSQLLANKDYRELFQKNPLLEKILAPTAKEAK